MSARGKHKASGQAKKNPEMLLIDRRYIRPNDLQKYKDVPPDEAIAALNDELIARALHQPEVRAARTIQRFEGEKLDINAAADELRGLVVEVQAGSMKRPEAMLVAQAHALDALFSALAIRSHANSREGCLDAADRYLRLALKAQAQAVRTIEALGELKNPRPVTFVRQANLATNQQVNNHLTQAGDFQNEPIKQSETLPSDNRASSLEGRVNSPVDALEKVDRATH